MGFCSNFDAQLAANGPAAVFLRDPEGDWRMNESWTRDCWGRAPGPHAHGHVFMVYRDRGSGFVGLALVTSPTLLEAHPRLDLRPCDSLEAAEALVAGFGVPPRCQESWA